jgi:hypothetical protein
MTSTIKTLLIAAVCLLACAACHTSKTTAQEDTSVDTELTLAQVNTAHIQDHHSASTDSVHVTDSTVVVVDNGNVYMSRYRDTYRTRNKTDTLLLSDTTTVYVYKNKVKKRTIKITKQAQLTAMQKVKLKSWAYLAIFAAILAAIIMYQNRKCLNKYLRKS